MLISQMITHLEVPMVERLVAEAYFVVATPNALKAPQESIISAFWYQIRGLSLICSNA